MGMAGGGPRGGHSLRHHHSKDPSGGQVGKLQDEVHERRAAHCRELQRRQAEVRRLVERCEASRGAVRAAREENQAMLEHINKAQTRVQDLAARGADSWPASVGDDLQVCVGE